MEEVLGLVVVLAVLLAAGVVALVLAHRASGPLRLGEVAAEDEARRVLRRSALQAVVGLLAGWAAALVALIGNEVVGGLGNGIAYTIPLLAAAAGLIALAAVPSGSSPSRAISSASLSPRRAQHTVPRSWAVACCALAVAPVVVVALSTTLPVYQVVYPGLGIVALAALIAVLLALTTSTLHRIAVRPALPAHLKQADDSIRGAGGRLVVTITACALLVLTAALALDSGGWALNNAPFVEAAETTRLQLVGSVLTGIGAVAGITALASAISAVALTATLCVSATALRRAVPAEVHA